MILTDGRDLERGRQGGGCVPQTDELDEDQAADFFSAQTRTAVADDDGRVVGLYILHPNNVGRCAHTANASYAVDSSVRGKGLGRALVQDALDHLDAVPRASIQCGGREQREPDSSVRSLGFHRVGVMEDIKERGVEDMIIFVHAAPP